ncbi:MAG TPA: hypothetical protein VIV60_24890, partial [Polyangiaceae bacterium]
PRRTLRTIGLAALFTLAGTSGLLFAYQLWSSGASESSGVVTPPLPATVPAAPTPIQTPNSGPVSPSSSAPNLPGPALAPAPPSHHLAHAAAAVREAPAPPPAPTVPAPAANPNESQGLGSDAHNPAPATGEETPDNRHISRGVH